MLENGVPRLQNFRLPNSDFSLVEVTADDPLNFVWRHHVGRVPGNWTGMRLGDHAVRIHARATALEYIDCRERRYPTFVHIHQKIIGVERNYVKLTAPLADESGAVAHVVYAFLPLTFTVVDGGLG